MENKHIYYPDTPQSVKQQLNVNAWSVGFCRGSRVEGRGSRVEVEGKKKCFFVRSISIRSRFSHILGFHLTSAKTRIKNFEFLSSSGRSQF